MTANLKVPAKFDEAPKTERIAFVEELWGRIAWGPGVVPVPNEHKRIPDDRSHQYQQNPRAGEPWSKVRDRLTGKFQ